MLEPVSLLDSLNSKVGGAVNKCRNVRPWHLLVSSYLIWLVLFSEMLAAQTLGSQTLVWSTPVPIMLDQQATLYGQVIGNGVLAPTGTVTFNNSGSPIGTGTVSSVTNTNFLLYSSQFSNPAWQYGGNGVLTPNYSVSPLGDQTAYRYQNTDQAGASVYQSVPGLPGNQPVTFSVCGVVRSTFTVQFNLSHGTIGTIPVTNVMVQKSQQQ